MVNERVSCRTPTVSAPLPPARGTYALSVAATTWLSRGSAPSTGKYSSPWRAPVEELPTSSSVDAQKLWVAKLPPTMWQSALTAGPTRVTVGSMTTGQRRSGRCSHAGSAVTSSDSPPGVGCVLNDTARENPCGAPGASVMNGAGSANWNADPE